MVSFLYLFLSLSLLFASSVSGRVESIQPIEREVYLMGTSFHLTLYESQHEKGLQDLEELVRTVETTENQLSTWKSDSEISRLNRLPVAEAFTLSPSLCVLWRNLEFWVNRTGGSFDPSVGALTNAWGIHGNFRIPSEKEIAVALQETGFQFFERTECRVVKVRPVVIDVGAFGKGEAIDRALQVANDRKMGPLLIDFGGQLGTRGTPPGKTGWDSFLANPVHRQEPSRVHINLRSGSLSTSGGSERDGEVQGKRIGHHLDPKTGRPVEFFGSVTVWREKALEADILSTALYVMEPEKGFKWAVQENIAACFQIIKGKEIGILRTPAFESLSAK